MSVLPPLWLAGRLFREAGHPIQVGSGFNLHTVALVSPYYFFKSLQLHQLPLKVLLNPQVLDRH